jgi:hypothetical protein
VKQEKIECDRTETGGDRGEGICVGEKKRRKRKISGFEVTQLHQTKEEGKRRKHRTAGTEKKKN